MENDQFKLPENAHRELKPGEEYEPILSKNKKYQEVTVWSVCIGLLMMQYRWMNGRGKSLSA